MILSGGAGEASGMPGAAQRLGRAGATGGSEDDLDRGPDVGAPGRVDGERPAPGRDAQPRADGLAVEHERGVGAALGLGPRAGGGERAMGDADGAETTETWSVDLSTVDGDDANVVADGVVRLASGTAVTGSAQTRSGEGLLTASPRALARPADRISVRIDADVPAGSEVLIDVRGRGVDGAWGEWIQATPDTPAQLVQQTDVVQSRLVLRGTADLGPAVRSVELAAHVPTYPAAPRLVAAAEPKSFRVFATREGLVGGTTANGHVIVERDHFAALPSRRGLSNRDSGEYSVQVCAANGRCAWAPVWDVGPWNTRDDYWNAHPPREMWVDLPQGKPQSQAAFQDGYHNGRDQFDREVRNPAGIDLADGTFWDALGLTENAWVTVTYLWTGTGAFATVQTPADIPALNVRAGANAGSASVGLAANSARVRVECQVRGQRVSGTQGTSNIWLRIAKGKYVAKAYVSGVPDVRACG
jgi:hypothetical protein